MLVSSVPLTPIQEPVFPTISGTTYVSFAMVYNRVTHFLHSFYTSSNLPNTYMCHLFAIGLFLTGI